METEGELALFVLELMPGSVIFLPVLHIPVKADFMLLCDKCQTTAQASTC